MRIFALALLLLLCPFSFSAVIWSTAATDAVNDRVVIAGNRAIYTSYDGSAYGADVESGAVSWVYDSTGKITLSPELVDGNTVAVATSKGNLVLFSASDGKVRMEKSLNGTPLSLAAGDGKIFVGFDDGLAAFGTNGKELWRKPLSEKAGEVNYENGVVYLVSGGRLYALQAGSGAEEWSSQMGESFLSRPVEYQGNVYVGGTDGSLYSFDYVSGRRQWAYKTGGWVMSSPTATTSSVYFGSNDGYFYSLSLSGKLNWKFKTGEAIWSQPAIHESEGRLLAVFGSNDGNVYALDTETGSQVWSFSAYGKPGSPSEYEGAFIFGTSAGRVYSLAASPVCSFSWPKNGDVVGNWSTDVEGSAHSDVGVDSVEVRADGGQWMTAAGTDRWYAPVDFSGVKPGAVTVECRALDRSGKREEGDYSFTTLVVSESAPVQRMSVSAPQEAAYNESFAITAKDGRGENLHGVKITVGDSEPETKNSPVKVILGKTGRSQITLEKAGFEPVSFSVNGTGGGDLLTPLLVVLAVLAAAFLLLRKRIAERLPAFLLKK